MSSTLRSNVMNADMVSFTVMLFAQLQQDIGSTCIKLSLPDGATCDDLFAQLISKYNISIPKERIGVAINDHVSSWCYQIKSHDRVALLPPVSGG